MTSKLYHKIEFYLGDANLMILKWNCGILTTQGKKKELKEKKKKIPPVIHVKSHLLVEFQINK